MTGPTDTNEEVTDPTILIDEWPDGTIESSAWVEVSPSAPTAESAVEWIEKCYPVSDRAEVDEEEYICDGSVVRLCPDPDWEDEHGDEGTPWVEADPENHHHQGALDFWVVSVVCKL